MLLNGLDDMIGFSIGLIPNDLDHRLGFLINSVTGSGFERTES